MPADVLEALVSPSIYYPSENPQFALGGWAPVLGAADLMRRTWRDRQWSRVYAALERSLPAEQAELLALGRWDELDATLSASTASSGEDAARAHFALGSLRLLAGQWEPAVEALECAVGLNSRSIENQLQLAIALVRAERWEDAREILVQIRAIAEDQRPLDPVLAQVWLLEAQCLFMLEEDASDALEQSLKIYKRLAKIRPDLWNQAVAAVHCERAALYHTQQAFEDALQDYRAAVKAFSGSSESVPVSAIAVRAIAWRGCGHAWLDLGKDDKAFQAFQESVAALRDAVRESSWFREDLVQLHFEIHDSVGQPDVESALENLRESLRIAMEGIAEDEPRFKLLQAEAEMRLGGVYSSFNEDRDAIRHYRSAAALYESFPEKDSLLMGRLATACHGVGTLLMGARLTNDGSESLRKSIEWCERAMVENTLSDANQVELGSLACDAKLQLARWRLDSGRRDEGEAQLRALREEVRALMGNGSMEVLQKIMDVEGALLAIYANEKRFDIAEQIVRQSMDFLRPYSQSDPDTFGDAFVIQTKHLIRLMEHRKASAEEVRTAAREAAALARNPVFQFAMQQIADHPVIKA